MNSGVFVEVNYFLRSIAAKIGRLLPLSQQGRAIGFVAIFYGANIVLGLLRDVVLAAQFGATEELDALYIAISLMRTSGLLVAITVATALVPVLITVLTQNDYLSLNSFVRRGIKQLGFVSTAMSIGCFLLAEPIARLVGPGLSLRALDILTSSIRILSPLLLILGLAGIGKALGDSLGKYIAYPILLACMTSGLVLGVFLFGTEIGVLSAAFGLLAGGVVGLVLQTAMLNCGEPLHGMRREFLALKTENHISIDQFPDLPFKSILILSLTSFVVLTQGLVERAYVSNLQPGSVVSLSLALSLIALPTVLIMPATSSVLLPHFSRQALGHNSMKFGLSIKQYLSLIATFLFVTAIYWFGSDTLINLAFRRGAFSATAASQTAQLLRILSIGFAPYVLATIFRQVLLAHQMVGIDFAIATATLMIKLFLLQAIVSTWGLDGLATVVTVVAFVSAGMYYGAIRSIR